MDTTQKTISQEHFVYLFQNGFRFDPILYAKKAIDIFRTNVGYFITFTFLLMLAYFILKRLLPVWLSFPLRTVLPLFTVGYYWVCNQTINDEKIKMRDFLMGFSRFKPCYSAGLVTILPLILATLIGQALGYPFLIILSILALIPSILYIFALPLVFCHNLSLWDAMETSRKIVLKQPQGFFIMYLLIITTNIVGILLLLVGLLATIPLSHAMIYSAYDDIISQNHDKV